MAQYRCSIKPIVSRGKGASVARAAAYYAREKIEDERTGEAFDFSRHGDKALWSGVYAPKNAPEWANDLQSLVTEIERAEKRKDAQLALPIELSLAHELTLEQNRWMLQDFVRENFTRQGFAAIASIHEPPRHGDERNIHAHLLVTLRTINEDGFSPTKKEQQAFFLNKTERTEALRQSWEKHLKHHLERHGFTNEAEAVTCKSLADQGIDREPTKHLGPVAAHMERTGEKSDLGDLNRDIEARNRERERLQIEARTVGRELTEAEQARRLERKAEAIQGNDAKIPQQGEKRKRNHRKEAEAALTAFAHWTDNGNDFQKLVEEKGFLLAADGKAGVVALDKWGSVYNLKKLAGEKVGDIERAALPTVEQAKDIQEDRRERRAAASLENAYSQRGDMVTQQQAAMSHHAQRQKALDQTNPLQEREAAALKRLEAKAQQQREHEGKERAEQTKREKNGFAARKDHGQQKVSDRAARTEQTDRKQRTTQSLAEKLYGKSFQPSRIERDDNERERER